DSTNSARARRARDEGTWKGLLRIMLRDIADLLVESLREIVVSCERNRCQLMFHWRADPGRAGGRCSAQKSVMPGEAILTPAGVPGSPGPIPSSPCSCAIRRSGPPPGGTHQIWVDHRWPKRLRPHVIHRSPGGPYSTATWFSPFEEAPGPLHLDSGSSPTLP